MAKLTFNSVVYLKSTLEKVYVRAIITRGQSKKYKLSNGMIANIEDLLDELPVAKIEPVANIDPVQDDIIMEPTPKQKSKPKKTDKC